MTAIVNTGGREKDKDRRDRHRERDRDRDRDRDRERDRERDRDHRHRSKRSEPHTPVDGPDKEFNPPTGPRGSASTGLGIEIKGTGSLKSRESASAAPSGPTASRRSSQGSVRVASGPAAPQDPHAAERAARDRERLLKETRRIASLASLAGASVAGTKLMTPESAAQGPTRRGSQCRGGRRENEAHGTGAGGGQI